MRLPHKTALDPVELIAIRRIRLAVALQATAALWALRREDNVEKRPPHQPDTSIPPNDHLLRTTKTFHNYATLYL